MKIAEIPKTHVQDMIKWGLTHPKFTPDYLEPSFFKTIHYADDRVMLSCAGLLIFRLSGVGNVDLYAGSVRLEDRSKHNPLKIMSLWVHHDESTNPPIMEYEVYESLDRRRHFMRERLRENSSTGFHLTDNPNTEAFKTHLNVINSALDFDWSEAEQKAAAFRDSQAA